jgi:RsmE family RNA methyltransferase
MNLLLLRDDDFLADGTARLTGRRLLHAREVLRAAAGDVLRVGRLRGNVGTGEVLRLTGDELVLRCQLDAMPPARPAIDLLLAMPRPKALRRILPALASIGVDRLVLSNAARVEKSYFDSKTLAQIDDLLALGLEQARDTVPPEVIVRDRLRPFVEDELAATFGDGTRLLAHGAATLGVPRVSGRALIAVGPEGGWVPFELDLFARHGFSAFTLGPRPLRVEVAVPAALGALSAARAL